VSDTEWLKEAIRHADETVRSLPAWIREGSETTKEAGSETVETPAVSPEGAPDPVER
jgi:hypothetical protein